MQEQFEKRRHTLTLENRELLELSGITDVGAFNEEEISVQCEWGTLRVKGSRLHIETLDVDAGVLRVRGTVSALVYQDNIDVKGAWRRLFS